MNSLNKVRDFLFYSELNFRSQRFPILDILRITAALMVVLYHFTASGVGNTRFDDRYNLVATSELFPAITEFTKFGFLGVNLFFLISGFIIFSSAYSRNAVDFAVNRFIRLYPTYWLSIIATLLVLYGFLGFEFELSLTTILSNLTMVQSYLGEDHLDPVYWTLVVELHFYFLIFIAILTGQMKAWRFWITVWLVLAWSTTLTGQPAFYSYLFDASYTGYFTAGILFCSRLSERWNLWSVTFLILSYFLCLYNIPVQIEVYNFGEATPTDRLIGYSIVTAYFLIFNLFSSGSVVVKTTPFILSLGAITYPLYLFHHQFGRYFIDRFYESVGALPSITIAILISVLAAWIMVKVTDEYINKKLTSFYKTHFKARWQQGQTDG